MLYVSVLTVAHSKKKFLWPRWIAAQVYKHNLGSSLRTCQFPLQRAASKYIRNMAKKEILDTFIILLRLRLHTHKRAQVCVLASPIPYGFSLGPTGLSDNRSITSSALHRWEGQRDGRQRKTSGWAQHTQSEKDTPPCSYPGQFTRPYPRW